MKVQITTLILITMTAIGCNSVKKTNGNTTQEETMISTDIGNTTWQLTKLEGSTIDQSNAQRKKIQFTLNSVDNTVSGYSGCNIFNGSYTLEKGNRIKFSKLASTLMACPDVEFNENEFLKVFDLTDNYTVTDGTLMLNVGKRAPLAVFKKVTAENQIVEKYWKLKTLEGQEVKMAENQEREIYFTLKTNENRVTGFAGCNTLNGEYTLEPGNRIRFSNLAVTLRACPDIDVNESEFLEVFNLADNYTINGDTLSLNVGRRAPLAVFEAVYFN